MEFPTHIVAAAGYVFDKDGNILIVKTRNRGWDCTGGQIENGESLEEGVLREITEESGVRAKVKCLCGVYSNVADRIFYDGVTVVPTMVVFDFICEYIDGVARPSDETPEVMWVTKDKVIDYITAPVQKYRFRKVLDFDGRITYASYIKDPDFNLQSERYI